MYKLVAVKQPDGSYTPRMKCSDSASKAIIPGKKMPWRLYDENGQAQCDLIAMDEDVYKRQVCFFVAACKVSANSGRVIDFSAKID